MINDLLQYFKDKKILILGFGNEGQSTYKLIRKYLKNQKLYIADKKEIIQSNFSFLNNDDNVEFIGGEKYLDNLDKYDVIMKSPGISFVGIDTSSYIHKIKSQLELLLEFFDIFTIGITGTKGKSTTSSLIHKVLNDQGVSNMLLGNIGIPAFDYIDSIKENTTIVLEMSSHQLEYMKVSPNIAILLNIYEEHLDHYESFEKYAKSKCNIFKFQSNSDFLLYNSDNEVVNNLVKSCNRNKATKSPFVRADLSFGAKRQKLKGNSDFSYFLHSRKCNFLECKKYKVSLKNASTSDIYLDNDIVYFNNNPIYNKNEARNLIGDYNLNNIMFVLGVSEILNLDMQRTIKSISEFKPLNHRLEFVGKYDNVLYYDNSIGTIPMATIEAVNALKNVDTLIIGGMDRGINYDDFIEFLNKSEVRNIVCMPKTGHDIAKKLNEEKAHVVETLEEAVKIAKKVTAKGKICLLSPAAASYGYFKNFEEKGDLFKKLVGTD